MKVETQSSFNSFFIVNGVPERLLIFFWKFNWIKNRTRTFRDKYNFWLFKYYRFEICYSIDRRLVGEDSGVTRQRYVSITMTNCHLADGKLMLSVECKRSTRLWLADSLVFERGGVWWDCYTPWSLPSEYVYTMIKRSAAATASRLKSVIL